MGFHMVCSSLIDDVNGTELESTSRTRVSIQASNSSNLTCSIFAEHMAYFEERSGEILSTGGCTFGSNPWLVSDQTTFSLTPWR